MRRTLLLLATALAVVVGAAGPALAAPAPAPAETAAPAAPAAAVKPPPTPNRRAGTFTIGKGAARVLPPPRASRSGAPGLEADGKFYYAGAVQWATSDGASGSFVATPSTLVDGATSHSLVELAVRSADTNQIVEVGLTVDAGLNGENRNPHLFVFNWVDGNAKCYNLGCGFVQVANADPKPGSRQPANSRHSLAIQHYQGNWWIGDWYYTVGTGDTATHGGWFGYYPDSVWGGRYTQVGVTQWFGEVETSVAVQTPCNDMGNGQLGSDTGAADIAALKLINGPASNVFLNQSHPQYYKAGFNGNIGIRYGGPGGC
jgi:hypothetical protein